jgi:hypothetical protein
MKKVIIFGAGGIGRRLHDILSQNKDISIPAFLDNDQTKDGKYYNDTIILSPEKISSVEYDEIHYGTAMGFNELGEQLIDLKVDQSKIKNDYILSVTTARSLFLERYALELFEQNETAFSVAEAGVYKGEFASQINRFFPDQKLFLFDTFTGFDDRDFAYEENHSLWEANHFKETSESLVLDKMTTPENCIIKKGYFPNTATDIDGDFGFISLDLDLYKPTIDGLRIFYPKLISGGCILIHDYFSPSYPNVKKAVSDYAIETRQYIHKLPIGDDCSIALIK